MEEVCRGDINGSITMMLHHLMRSFMIERLRDPRTIPKWSLPLVLQTLKLSNNHLNEWLQHHFNMFPGRLHFSYF